MAEDDFDVFGDKEYAFDHEDDEDFGYAVEEEQKYEAEAKAFERTGRGETIGMTIIEGKGKIAELQKRAMREISSPDERFSIFVDAISRKLKQDKVLIVSDNDIQIMIDKSRDLKNIGYLNPSAYILAYVVTSGGKEINKKRFQQIVNDVLPDFKDLGIEPEDIIRYSRFWLKLK